MGLQFRDIVVKQEIEISQLKDKILAVDTMNMLYQFLTTIRGPDGSPLTDSKGRVTSHLIGLFNRVTSLMEEGLKLVFIFDGEPPAIKQKTKELRKAAKEQASLKLKEAEDEGDYAAMKSYASRSVSLTPQMVEDTKKVITALGLPIVQAPSEGEAQTAYMVQKGDAYASVSQDYDNLIFNCPRVVRNLSIAGKRKKAGKFAYTIVKPEIIELQTVLDQHSFTVDQLRILAIMVGTDYNPGGVKGIGPKTAIKLLQKHGEDFATIFDEIKWEEHSDISWQEILTTIKEIPTTDDYNLKWDVFNRDQLTHLLVEEYAFSKERVTAKLDKLENSREKLSQTGLGRFF